MKIHKITLATLTLALAAGCSHTPAGTTPAPQPKAAQPAQPAQTTQTAPATEAPQTAHSTDQAAAPAMTFLTVKGKVAEAIDTDRNTYVLVDTGDGKRWAVLPKVPVTVGQEVELRGMLVTNYASKALNRTFDTIVFSDGLKGNKAAPMDIKSHAVPKGHPAIGK